MESIGNQSYENELIGGDEVHRINISKMAEEALVEVLKRVNDGFEGGGRVNRTQMANWILMRFASQCSDSDIQQIRAENVNELAVLEAILKKSKKTGKLPADVAGAPHTGDTNAAQGVAGAEAEFQTTKIDFMGPISCCLVATPQ
jgi:hypothetical protein